MVKTWQFAIFLQNFILTLKMGTEANLLIYILVSYCGGKTALFIILKQTPAHKNNYDT